jgi:lipopolysaccharide export system permease protein
MEIGVFGILQRAIFWELLKAFALSLVALTGILLLAGIVAEASQRGLSPTQILAAIPLIMPSLMPYTIPSTTLFATCLVYGRLAHDNEIVAIKAAGINILQVVWPGVLLGILTSAATLGLYYQVIPNTQYILRTQFLNDVEEFLYTLLKNDRTINHPKLNYAIWVRQVQGRRLLDATFKRRDARGQYDLVAWAREAELRVDSRNKQVLVHMRNCNVLTIPDRTAGYFEDRVWPVPMPNSPIEPQQARKAREMTLAMLHVRRVELLDETDDVTAELAWLTARSTMGGTPDDLALHRSNLDEKRKEIHRTILSIDMELYMRPAVACGCLCFVLVGCPVGIWFSKRDYLSAFITCFLPIVLLYYPLLLCGVNLTRYGRGDPLLMLWSCNAVMLFIAFFLMRRLIRH